MPKLSSSADAPSKKVKKDKSSKKRKSEAITKSERESSPAPYFEQDVSLHDASEETAPVESDEEIKRDSDDVKPRTSKKRKTSVEEIEVDITLPEPPSKKALRALKKGKPLPPSKSGAESTPEPEPKKAKKAEVEKRSEHGVWIGNLPFHISKEVLRAFLVENSDITEEMITRVHMPGPNDTKSANKVEDKRKFKKVENNKGFAYVDFSTAEGVKEAVELSEQLLSGRRLLIKDNKSFEGRPEKTKEETRKEGKPPSRKVFIGNLSYDVTEDSLKEHFLKCGPIATCMVAAFEDSGKCKGYGWVTFEELEGAQNAVNGFVRIEEEISDASESEDDSDSDASESKPKAKKTKLRKWWVNKIKGRPLRAEFAEDAQVRYKKRYGKDGSKNAGAGGAEGASTEKSEVSGPYRPKNVVEHRQPYAARLTGGIVESKGTKVTF
ncbi:related to S.pombe Rnp24p, Nsr1p and human splicing factor [Phialocephala subalpina]|uniref:Related to S.pombe Rnp24p, Nsr1p and human splicing factor n=1 Tax=Phialocephala subalpina TaxID=576137 RepID=A0A1L7X685_9HELO|nr:related to S.pombe Rnp24p, Nsr1p and human splicing factor [Phialocephala subalpina]